MFKNISRLLTCVCAHPWFSTINALSVGDGRSSASQGIPIRHLYSSTRTLPPVRHPLPPDSPYKFRRKKSEFLEPVGEFQEFQSAEGSSRQVLLHVWPPSNLDAPLLQKLEACCKEFQDKDIVRGHSGDGFLNGWRPSWKQAHQTGVLRFGHWRVRAPAGQGTHLYVSHLFYFIENGGVTSSFLIWFSSMVVYITMVRHIVASISDTFDTCSWRRLCLGANA